MPAAMGERHRLLWNPMESSRPATRRRRALARQRLGAAVLTVQSAARYHGGSCKAEGRIWEGPSVAWGNEAT